MGPMCPTIFLNSVQGYDQSSINNNSNKSCQLIGSNCMGDLLTHKTPYLRWWLCVALMLVTTIGAVSSGIVENVYNTDVTKLSFVIFGLLIIMTGKAGLDTFRLVSKESYTGRDIEEKYAAAELGWFTSDLCLTVGMIGTVAGFIFMLSTAFASIDVSNVASLQNVLSQMSAGMGTALYTTAAGLISSAFLKIQYFNFSTEIDRLAVEHGIAHGESKG